MQASFRARGVAGVLAVVLAAAGIATLNLRDHASGHSRQATDTTTVRPGPPAEDRVRGGTVPVGTLPEGTTTVPLRFGGAERSYLLERPTSTTGSAALVVLLHGTGVDAREELDRTGFGVLAQQRGFEVAVPQSIGRTWNSGAGCCSYEAEQRIDDIAFVRAVVSDVRDRTSIDPARIYLVGYSNGGKLAYGVACTGQRVFAGLATYGAGPQLPCTAAAPLALFVGFGTNDPLEPPKGMAPDSRGRHPGLASTVAEFVRRDRCAPTVERSAVGTAVVVAHTRCTAGTAIEAATWHGEDHTFPAPPRTTPDAAGATLMWQFLSRRDT